MELISSLGVNSTIGIQFAVFVVTYIFMYFVLLKPYFLAYEEREKRTVGQTELAERLIAESLFIQEEFETKARSMNEKYRGIYDESRTAAMRSFDQKVNEARSKAKTIVDEAQGKIVKEIEQAQRDLKNEIPEVAKNISSKLLGKEISL